MSARCVAVHVCQTSRLDGVLYLVGGCPSDLQISQARAPILDFAAAVSHLSAASSHLQEMDGLSNAL